MDNSKNVIEMIWKCDLNYFWKIFWHNLVKGELYRWCWWLGIEHNSQPIKLPPISTYTSCFKEDKQLPTQVFFGTNFEKCSTPYIHATFLWIPYKIEKDMLKKRNINDVYCLFLCHFNVLELTKGLNPMK